MHVDKNSRYLKAAAKAYAPLVLKPVSGKTSDLTAGAVE